MRAVVLVQRPGGMGAVLGVGLRDDGLLFGLSCDVWMWDVRSSGRCELVFARWMVVDAVLWALGTARFASLRRADFETATLFITLMALVLRGLGMSGVCSTPDAQV